MLSDDDEFDPQYDCPQCSRSFHSFTRLDEHMTEHEGPRRCNTCGETIRGNFHRCR